jgi:hypothetical protein
LDTVALALQLGPGVSVRETAPGRYRIEGASGPAATATLATWLAARDATLSDLVTGRTLEDVYFDAVGSSALQQTESSTDPDYPDAGDGEGSPGRGPRRGGRRRGRRGRRGPR